MRKFSLFLRYIPIFLLIGTAANAQIAVTRSGTAVTVPALAASYTSLSNALTALNGITAYAVPGTIIFTCAAGSSETAPATGLVIGSASLNLLLSSTNTVTIVKASGTVTINAGVGTAIPTSASPDGMLRLNGADFVTIDGLTFTDGNTASSTVAMEFGIGLFKRTAGDGCNNNTIKNCILNLQRINNANSTPPMMEGSVAILVINSSYGTATTPITPTNGGTLSTNGTNSGNKFYTNTISSGNYGIGLSGYSAVIGVGPAPVATTFLGDVNNDIGGGTLTTGNIILNFGGGTSATNPSAGIRTNNQWSINIGYNTINNNNGSGINHPAILRGIYGEGGTSASATISNNTVTIKGGGTTHPVSAIENAIGSTAAANTVNISNNTVTGDYLTATTGTYYGIFNSASAADINLTGNTIDTISTSGTTIAGLQISNGSVTVSQNKIYKIQSTSSGSPAVSGISVSSASAATILNNLVGDLKAPNAVSASGADVIRGINLTSTTTSSTINVYYNTIYINAFTNGAQFSTSGIFHTASATATTAVLNMRNNVIYNTSTASGSGVTAAYRRSATNLANYAATSNNNLFYAGTVSATNLLFVEGTSSLTNPQQTIAGYKAYITGGRDASSFTENPFFQAISGDSTNFLKYKTSIALHLESGGVNIAGITTDFFGTIRQGNAGYTGTGTAPDIGAWELQGIADLSGPAISYTSLGNTSCLSDRTFSAVTITDASGVNITAGTRPRLYYRKGTNANTFNSNTSATDGWKYVEATGTGSSPFSFTMNYSLLNGGTPVAGDVIHYFVVAQNISGIPKVGINTGTFNTVPSSVALVGANFPVSGNNTYTLVSPLSTTVTVGSGGTYPTLTGTGGLFEAINGKSLSGNTTALIISSAITETGAVTLNQIDYGCSGGPYTLTIKPNAGVTTTLTGAYAGLLIRILSSNLIIDGSNNGTSGRNLTISNIAITSPSVMLIGSTGVTPITNVTLKNSIIINGSQLSPAILISNGVSPGSPGYFNNITLQNNSIQKANIGVYITAVISAGNGNGLLITGNDLNASGANSIRQAGIYCLGVDGATFSNNNIGNMNNAEDSSNITGVWLASGSKNITVSGNNISGLSGTLSAPRGIAISTGTTGTNNITVTNNSLVNLTSSGTATTTGIYLSGGTGGVKIRNNRISNIKNTNSGGYGSNAIQLSSTLTTSGTADVYNNEIFDVAGYGFAGSNSTDNGYGIMVELGGGYNIWFNSIRLTTNQTLVTGKTAAINISNNVTTAGSLNLRNNIFANTQTIGTRYAIYCNAANTVLVNTNYNDYYSTGPVAFLGGARTLSSWQAATGQDANSLNADPLFNSNTNLQALTGSPVAAAGVTGTGITTDITGANRGSPPTIGAYEAVGDFSGPVITYTNLNNTLCATTGPTLSPVTIADAVSGLNIASGTRPRVYFRKTTDNNTYTGNTSGNNGWKFVEATGAGGSPFSFTINYALLQSALVPGDIIQYFVVAQDLKAGTPNVSINSGTFTAAPVSVALTSTAFPVTGVINQFTLFAGGLSADVTIGAAGTYPSLTGAGGLFAAINAGGLTNNITASIVDASIAETGVNALNQISYGCTGSATLTIKPAIGVNTVLSGSVANGALIKLNGADNVIFDGSNNGTSSRNMSITNTSTFSATAVSLISLGTDVGAINNTIKNCNISTGSNTTVSYGVAAGGNIPGTPGADNDNVTIQNNNITGVSVGVYAYGSAAVSAGGNNSLTVTQNLITVNTTTTTTNYGIEVGNGVGGAISQNTISVTSNADGQPVGISLETGFLNASVSRNKITKVLTTSLNEYAGRGITIGTASASSGLTISNNVIYGVNGSNYSDFGLSSAMGIGIGMIGNNSLLSTIAGGINLYFNSVNMYGDFSGSSATITSALYIGSGTSNLDIRNNIFANSLNNTTIPGSINYCVFSDAADSTVFTNINNNDYYPVSSINSTGVVGFLNVDQSTLAAWKTATGKDANSISTNPFFTSNTDLRPQIGSTVVAAGGAGTGITTDFFGIARGTPPTIGAYEQAVSDIAPPAISYTPISNTLCTANSTLSATIIDATGVNITAGSKPRLYFKKSTDANTYTGNTSANNGWKYVEASNVSSPFNFTANYSLLQSPVVSSDIIQYFVVAQDVIAPPNVGISSNDTFAVTPTSVDLTAGAFPITGAINSYTIIGGGLSGTVNVGPGQTYLTLTATGGLFAALNSGGLTGNLLVNITGNITEDGTNALNSIKYGCSGSATLTIKPTGTFTISGSFAGGLIRLNGADNVTIDGSTSSTLNTVCPVSAASRNLTITNTNSSDESAVVWLQSNGIDGATGNTVKNCNLTGSGVTQTLFGVGSGNSAINTVSFGIANNNNSFVNNNISGVQYGIYSQGQDAAHKNTGTVINQNTITASANTLGGIWVGFENNITISGNSISNIAQANSPDVFGISCGFGSDVSSSASNGNEVTNATITKNVIGSVVNTGTFSAFGIGVSEAFSGTNLIANNMIYGVVANCSAGDIAAGIILGGGLGSTTKVYYNTVSMQGVITGAIAATETSACLVVTNVTTAPTLDLRNNIFINTQVGNVGATIGFATIALDYTDFSSLTSNNNDLYCAGAGPGTYQIGITTDVVGGTSSVTLANWQTTTGKDGASLNLLPNFVSSSDLHLITTSNCALDGYGTPVIVTDDIDCNGRDVTTPDMGADEFTAINSATLAGIAGSAVCENKTVSVAGTVYATGGCNLIAKVLPSGALPVSGKINVCVTLDAVQNTYYNQPFVQRHFDIEPATNPSTATGTVTLYFTNTEFVNYNTNNPIWPAMPTVAGGGNADPNRANLRITQYHGTPTSSPSVAGSYTGAAELIDPADANITWNGTYWSVTFDVSSFCGFYVHTSKDFIVPIKVYLQGAYSTALAKHKINTAAWVGALNAGTGGNALSQPYGAAPFSYAGTESVPAGYFKASASTVAPMDWVLVELRSGTNPATVITRRAAFVRVDGRIVDLDSTTDLTFKNLPAGTYHLVIRHRNHLPVRTSSALVLNGLSAILYDFTTAQSKAYQNPAITTNTAMKDLGGGVFGMWGGNANGMTSATGAATTTRASGGGTINDYLYLVNTVLGGNVSLILANRYLPADMNMDGTVRASGGTTINDYLFLANSVLGGNIGIIITQHQ